MRKAFVCLLMAFCCLSLSVSAQKKVVVMGSSTALGSAATSTALSWVGRMQSQFRKNSTDGVDTVFQLVGGYGYVTYNQMPSTYTPPPGRPPYIPGYNVEQALSLSPDIVIINLPTNDVASGFTKKEMMDNLRYLHSYILSNGVNGIKCYITTTQPRNDLSFELRDSLRTLTDSIVANFGTYAINFWDVLVTADGQYLLRDEVRHIGFPDAAYHLNNQGHLNIYQQASAKNIFNPAAALPVILRSFQTLKKDSQTLISWEAEEEEPYTHYQVQRSADGQHYQTIHALQARATGGLTRYQWVDQDPLKGKNLYRLKITENNIIRYSAVMTIRFDEQNISIGKLNMNAGLTALMAEISCRKSQKIQISIRNSSGILSSLSVHTITAPVALLNIPLNNIGSGLYFFTITDDSGKIYTRAFIR